MADTQTGVAPTPTIQMAAAEDLPLPPPPALEDLPPPPPKESFSKFHQQRQANELRRLYRHIHPELRKNLAEAVAEDLAEVLDSEEPTEGDVQCMRWIFENWRLDAIGDHEKPAAKEPVPGGDVQATSPAVTGPDFPAHHDEDSIQQASELLQDPLLHSHSRPAGQRTPGESQTKTPKLEPTMSPRKKPQLPPKPAYLSQIPPPQRLPKPSALSPSSFQRQYKQGEKNAAIPPPANVPTTASQGCIPLAGCPHGQSQPSFRHGPSTMAPKPTTSQAVGSSSRSPEPPKLSALSSEPTSPQQGPRPLGEKPMEGSQQEVPESPDILQESQQELQSLLSQVQALEKEAASSVDVRALQRLFEAVPQLGGAPQAPAAPRKPEPSVEQAFGELTRVSLEVARLKEQTLARLLDIEEAVHKALSSMSSLQPEANTGGLSQRPPEDHSACKVSVVGSTRARPNCSVQEVGGQTAVTSQTEVPCPIEVQSQTKVRNHTEARGQAVSTATRKLETFSQDLGLPRVLPCRRDSPSSPTFISIESATRKLAEAPSPRDSPDVVKSTHQAQHVSQVLLPQKGVQDKARKNEVTQCSGQPKAAPASASPLPSERQKSVLELQTGPGGSQSYGAVTSVTEQYEEADEYRNTVLTSSTAVTEQAGSPRGPAPHLGLHTSPLLRQFLHSPAELSGGLAEAQRVPRPRGHSQPAAQ
ncbi:xin actin-binding repeat-containing protein 1 isoform X3 [Rhinolophus ferrumequinum]|uniref:xin actin-binding repeat-containing protein 1 isoform X3 n=1 Tax=Rhinolophus ferrumequinum TaxID=59479 RepID=UPI00140F8290|nr:xin actin-binding repeat-containing protein 1 isoform X3 [Rhinolophus ferrumequinum]